MSLTQQELDQIQEFKNKGYTKNQVKEYFAAKKLNRTSYIQNSEEQRIKQAEESQVNNLTFRDIVAAPANFLAKDAVDTFGDYLARRGIGTDIDKEVVRNYVEEPTGRQMAGATLQTLGLAADVGIAVGSLGAATPLTLGKNVALGSALGYVYDFSDDLIAEKSYQEALTPGMATLVGGAAPVAFAGLGAGYRALRPAQEAGEAVADDIGRAVARTTDRGIQEVAPEGAEAVGRGVEETVGGLGQRARRLGSRFEDTIEENAKKSLLKENSRPAVVRAIDDGIDLNTIMRVENADDVTRDAYRAVVSVAEGGTPTNAEIVSGEYATQMYRISKAREAEFGKALGDARRALGTDPVNPQVYQKTLIDMRDILRQNGIVTKADGTVEFSRAKYTDEKQAVIQKIWSRLAQYQDEITPQDVDDLAKFLSDTQFQTNQSEKIGDVFVDIVDPRTGETQSRPIFAVIRDAYDNMLAQVDQTGEIAKNKKLFSGAKKINENIESTWYRGINTRTAADEQLADASSLALRRLSGRAQSRSQYRNYYDALDSYVRGAVGETPVYSGPDAAEVSDFYINVVEPMYTKSTPQASFGGPFAGVRSMLDTALNLGKSNMSDQQKALRGLLDLENIPTSSATPPKTDDLFEDKGIIDRAKEAISDQRGSVSLTGDTTQSRLGNQSESSKNYNKLSKQGVEVINKFLKHVDGTQRLSGEELRIVKQQAQEIADRAGEITTTGSDRVLADGLAEKFTKQINAQ